jgi:NADPH-dependent FMN reductase
MVYFRRVRLVTYLFKTKASVYYLGQQVVNWLVNKKLRILGFAGSLRKGSYNKALLRAAEELVPSDVTMEVFDIEGIPLFNQDTEKDMPAGKRIQIQDSRS